MGAQMEGYGMVKRGQYTYGDAGVFFSDSGDEAEVGKFCSIAGGVHVFAGGNHRTDWISTYPFGHLELGGRKEGVARSAGKITIGNDVWIGSNVVIMSGTTVGHGAVIGAYSVLRGHYPPYSIVFGNPAVVQRMRFSDEDIKKLLEIAWWDWPIQQVKEVSLILQSNNLEALYEYAERRPR